MLVLFKNTLVVVKLLMCYNVVQTKVWGEAHEIRNLARREISQLH